MNALCLFLILAVVGSLNAEMRIEIFQGQTDDNTTVNYFGESTAIINTAGFKLFRLTVASLWDAITNFKRRKPNNVFLHDPTAHLGNLYDQYNWRQTTVNLKPIQARTLNRKTVPVVVLLQTFTNDHPTTDATFNIALSQQIENKVVSEWSENTEVGLNIQTDYNLIIAKSDISFNFKQSWGSKFEKTKTVTIGTTTGLQVILRPGESVIAELVARKGDLRVDVDYEASLIGYVVANYKKKVDGHHFWAYDVNSILDAIGLPRTVRTTETMNVGYYAEGLVRLSDGRTRKVLGYYPVHIQHKLVKKNKV